MIRSTLLLGFGLSVVAGSWLWIFWQDKKTVLNSPLDLPAESRLMVKPGTSMSELALQLAGMGWLDHPDYLIFEARLLNKAKQIKSGEFLVFPGTTPLQLLDLLVEGRVIQHSLTLVEGWDMSAIENAIKNTEAIRQTIPDWSLVKLASFLGLPYTSPEGLFFPDTYYFPRGMSDAEFLSRSWQRMQAILEMEWRKREENLPYQTEYEALIMASIIEKETGVDIERPQIAGVFVRRLQKGMKLQTDPTVIYAIGGNYNGDILRKHLSLDSPFNTYVYPGLPPTPIALAGRDAIHAALHPASGSSLYFVSKGDGTHYFSDNLEEHNRSVRKFQLRKD